MNPYATSYVGKVRKPPGGDSSDIFNLRPQKPYISVLEASIPADISKPSGASGSGDELHKDFGVIDGAGPSKNLDANSSKTCELKEESTVENISPELCDSMKVVGAEGKMDEENLMSNPNKHVHDHYNLFTGQSVDISGRPKLTDCSNKVITADGSSKSITGQDTFLKESADFGLSRPSIRIRYPPGGASSNIF